MPPFATAETIRTICSGVTLISCPIAMEPIELLVQRDAGLASTALLSRQIDIVGPAKPHALDVVGKALIAEPQRKLNRADVGGVLHDLLHRQQSERFPVVNLSSKDDDRPHLTIDDVARLGKALLESRSRRDDLEC